MSTSRFTIDPTDLQKLRGLNPSLWVCVGPEFSREEIKQQIFSTNAGFVADAVTDWESLCVRILGVPAERVLSPLARREGLRLILAQRAIVSRLPEIRRLRRKRSFLKKVDRAIQGGRLAAAHESERQVLHDRLESLTGLNHVRKEIEFVATVYEAWLEGGELWDLPRLLTAATEKLESGWPAQLMKPNEIRLLSYQKPEARLVALIGALEGQGVRVNWPVESESRAGEEVSTGVAPKWSWDRWHTIDDAVESLVKALGEPGCDLSREVILIPDDPGAKRSLKRALQRVGRPMADPRDHLALRQNEEIKAALLPLQVMASRCERETVVSWLRAFGTDIQKVMIWVSEIYSRGIQEGLESYSGGKLLELHHELLTLGRGIEGRLTLEELATKHLSLIEGQSNFRNVATFFAEFWATWIEEQALLGEDRRKGPLMFWWERVRDRMEGSFLRPDRSRPNDGVQVYRLSQAMPFGVREGTRVWLLGLPAEHLEAPVGDYWFSSRDRDALSAEFPVRSGRDARHERWLILKDWVQWATEVRVLDVAYDWDGHERETPVALLRKLPGFDIEKPKEKGAAPLWLPSYGGARWVQPQILELPIRVEGPNGSAVLDATELDHLSRCTFQWVGFDRWKLRDLEEPEIELPANIKGTLLHSAVEALARVRDSQGSFGRSVEDVLETVWKAKGLRGLLRGRRLEGYVKQSLLKILKKFCDEEQVYVQRAQTRVLSLEHDTRLELILPEGRVHGRPDRIDEHADGVFVIDYKSTTSVPTGRRMMEDGYRLQLPFYALAAARKFNKPAVGAQFVSLVPGGGRSRGIFFSKWNGSKSNPVDAALTAVTGANGSLFKDRPPEEVWLEFEGRVREVLRAYLSGKFRIAPKDSATECRSCSLKEVCGRIRLVTEEDEAAS